jgi:Prealbumin-like fold domain
MAERILGPAGSKRRRRFLLLLPVATVAALILALTGSATNTTLIGFEIDGNLVATTTNGSTVDWVDSTGTGLSSPSAALQCLTQTPSPSCRPATTNATGLVTNVVDSGGAANGFGELFRDDLKVDPDRTTFTQGDKENDFTNATCPASGACVSDSPYHIAVGTTPPQKDDLFDVASNSLASGNQAELDLGMIRTNNNGSSHVDFELNRIDWSPGSTTGGVACASVAKPTTIPNFKCPQRTEGDLLISFEITPSSVTPPVDVEVRVFCWDLTGGIDCGQGKRTTADTPGSTVNCDGPLHGTENTCPWEEIDPPNASEIATSVNGSDITGPGGCGDPWGSRTPSGAATCTIPAGGWFEAGLDLDAIGFPPACPGFAVASAKARSSGSSVTSALTDLAGPFKVNLNSCGAIKIVKTAKNHNSGDSLDHGQNGVTFTISGPNGYSNTVVTSGSGSNAGTACVDNLTFGSYTVTETVPTGYQADSTNPQTTNVSTNATCGSGNENTLSFHNTPLSDVAATFTSNAGTGVTQGSINCGSGDISLGSTSTVILDDKVPGTYNCTVTIDP